MARKTNVDKYIELLSDRTVPLIKDKRPETVCHYTDISGFMGVIKDKGFRFSSLNYLNDPEELNYGQRALVAILEVLHEKTNKRKAVASFIEELIQSFDTFSKSIKDGAYSLSMSTERDDLSQWRAYCPNGGVCLELYTEYYCDSLPVDEKKNYTKRFVDIYNREKSPKEIISFSGDISYLHIDDNDLPPIEKEIGILINKIEADGYIKNLPNDDLIILFTRIVTSVAHFIKQPAYHHESEYRYLYLMDNISQIGKRHIEKDFRCRGEFIIPYYNGRQLSESYGDGEAYKNETRLLPIKSVTVCPGGNPEKTKESVIHFLEHQGYTVKDGDAYDDDDDDDTDDETVEGDQEEDAYAVEVRLSSISYTR